MSWAGPSSSGGGAAPASALVWAVAVLNDGVGESSSSGGAAAGGGGASAGGGGAAAGGGAAGGAAAAAAAGVGWIDPDWLEEKCDYCACGLCFGVMEEPASGCPEGHSFCRACFVKELRERKLCPTCRHPVADENKLVRIRPLEGMISQLRLKRCEHAEGGEGKEGAAPPAAKRAKLAPAASMTVEVLRKELRQRGLESTGNRPGLVARLEEDRQKDAGCRWRGRVGELAAHLGECEWAPVKCPNEGCAESPLRKDLPEHEATLCEHRAVKCRHCKFGLKSRLLAEHEGRCPRARIECPNEGCSGQLARGLMNLHRAECEHEEVACPCPGCDARLLRKGMDAHVEATHMQSAAKQLQSLWHADAKHRATSGSEQRLAAALPTSFIFNWRADGWGPGSFESETGDFGDGVTGSCFLQPNSNPEYSHHIGVGIKGLGKCKMHATLSILDKHDKPLRQVHKIGTTAAPTDVGFTNGFSKGRSFTPTAEDKAHSVRADGSIRLRVVVRLFLDAAA